MARAGAGAGRARDGAEPERDGDGSGGPERDGDFVQSLARGLSVIRAFGADRPSLTLAEVAAATGLSRAAARRFLLTLVELGYVRSDGRQFSLRPRVLDLGYAYLSGLSLAEVAQPHVEELVARVHESSSVAVLDGDEIVYVVRVPTSRIMRVAISIGTRFPASCTSMGRVLLAARPPGELDHYLDRVVLVPRTGRTVTDRAELRRILEGVARQGYALVEEELEDGLVSVAAPVRDATGDVVAAVNVSASASRVRPAALRREVVPLLLETAAQVERGLRARG